MAEHARIPPIIACDTDGETLQFLAGLPGVEVAPYDLGKHRIVLPAGVQAKRVESGSDGSETWLYRFPSGQVLGHNTESSLPQSVWPATEAMWNAPSPYEFARVCYETLLAAGRLPAGTLPPNPGDYED